MEIQEIREKILNDDEFVLSETKKLQYLFKPKKIIRSHLSREITDVSESVADHVYGMLLLSEYFRQVEPLVENLNYERVSTIIFAHDLSEIETGDISTNKKTEADRQEERDLFPKVIENSPLVLQKTITEAQMEYEEQQTPESQFVKAVDKLEPFFQFYDDSHRPVFEALQFTKNDLERTKKVYIEPYQVMYRFYEVIGKEFEEKKFFYEPA